MPGAMSTIQKYFTFKILHKMVNIINNINKIDSQHNCKLNGKMKKKLNYRYCVVCIKVEILTVCTCYHKIVILITDTLKIYMY